MAIHPACFGRTTPCSGPALLARKQCHTRRLFGDRCMSPTAGTWGSGGLQGRGEEGTLCAATRAGRGPT